MKLIDKYIQFLYDHPEMMHSIILWNITMFFVYFILIKYRTKMIQGSEGASTFWEMPEQWGYIWIYVAAPITCYAGYFKSELPNWVWWFNAGVAGYTIGGRWIFEWVLAVRSGATRVESSTKTITEKVELKTEKTDEKINS